jgi:hypothetical protein
MTRVLWIFALLAAALWTLLAWGVYGLISFFGETAARNADMVTTHPAGAEWLAWGFSALRNVGLAAVVVVWGVVSAAILAVPTLLSLALRALGSGQMVREPMAWPPQHSWRSDEPRPGYRDVTPDRAPSNEDDTRLIERR